MSIVAFFGFILVIIVIVACTSVISYEGDVVIYKDNNAERRGNINWDSKAAAFCFGQGFLVHYPSENMVVIGNKYDKKIVDY